MSTAGRLPGPARFAQAVMMGVNVLVIVAVTIWDVWATWVAFFGGVLPVPFGRLVTGGSLLLGALFVFVVSPVIFGVARLVTAGLSALVVAAAAAPAFAVRAARDARADHSPASVQPKSFDEAPTLFDDAPMLFDDAPMLF